MSLAAIEVVEGSAVVVDGDDIDTDRIIPARFLKCVTFDDLVPGLFADDRALSKKGVVHPLDDKRFSGASVFVVGRNFGCGSSREHAPQAIRRSGYEVVIGHSFAEIFFGNSSGIGLPCVSLGASELAELQSAIQVEPQTRVKVDLRALEVSFELPEGETKVYACQLNEGIREAFLEGKWDMIAALLEADEDISRTESRLGLRPS